MCPITMVNFQKKGTITEPNVTVLEWSDELELIFSRDSNHEAISETRIDELQPCVDPNLYRLS